MTAEPGDSFATLTHARLRAAQGDVRGAARILRVILEVQPAHREAVKTVCPLGRAGTGEDVANMVTFLCSEQGAWVTGQHIYVDGGHGATPRRSPSN